MHQLSIRQLHALRLAILENASDLHREAKILLDHGAWARSYLLAHLCFEELGKLPIVLSVALDVEAGREVNWKAVRRRYSNHESKIASENGHLYAFGNGAEGFANLHRLLEANSKISESFQMKNRSTYVDVDNGTIARPTEQVSEQAAFNLVDLAFECLCAHQRSEGLTNPILYEPEERAFRRK